MSKFDGNFREIWLKRKINIVEYEFCHEQLTIAHNKKMLSSLFFAILFFGLAIWFTYEKTYIGTVVALALAANFNSKSNQHMLFTEVLSAQSLLAKLINRKYMDDDKYLDEIDKSEDNLN